MFRFRRVEYADFPTINGRLFLSGSGRLTFGRGVVINSSHRSNPVGLGSFTSINVVPGASIVIEDRVGISNSLLFARHSITIERDVNIGGGCQIIDNDFHALEYVERVHEGDLNVAGGAVVIGEGAFIGTGSIILKGVTVGPRSVVAAGSVVSKSIPSDEIWGATPVGSSGS